MADKGKILELLPVNEPVVVAFSGGVDSTVVACLVAMRNPTGMLAVTIISPLSSDREIKISRELACELGIPHLELHLDELTHPRIAENHPLRCYYCKRMRYEALLKLAREKGFRWVMDGSNADDALKDRPGRRAAAELGIRSPLEEAGTDKEAVRRLARELGLPNWDAPSRPCLATRFPTGTPLIEEEIRRVERGESLLEAAGFREFRLRSPEPGIALLEISTAEMDGLRDHRLREFLVAGLRGLGFRAILLDQEGYREGSMTASEPRRVEALG